MQENYFNETLNKPSQPKPLILALIQQKTLKICSSFLMPSLKSRMLVCSQIHVLKYFPGSTLFNFS